jgi:hypothetical protein
MIVLAAAVVHWLSLRIRKLNLRRLSRCYTACSITITSINASCEIIQLLRFAEEEMEWEKKEEEEL